MTKESIDKYAPNDGYGYSLIDDSYDFIDYAFDRINDQIDWDIEDGWSEVTIKIEDIKKYPILVNVVDDMGYDKINVGVYFEEAFEELNILGGQIKLGNDVIAHIDSDSPFEVRDDFKDALYQYLEDKIQAKRGLHPEDYYFGSDSLQEHIIYMMGNKNGDLELNDETYFYTIRDIDAKLEIIKMPIVHDEYFKKVKVTVNQYFVDDKPIKVNKTFIGDAFDVAMDLAEFLDAEDEKHSPEYDD